MAGLQSGDFLRLRLGVGRPLRKEDIVEYVLSPFTAVEAEDRQAMLVHAVEWVEKLLAASNQPQGG
jgi:PTH1 family peptidyl-tRNA hydrolase